MTTESETLTFTFFFKRATRLHLVAVIAVIVSVTLIFYLMAQDLAHDMEKDLRNAFDQQKLSVVEIASSRVGWHIDNDVAENVRLLGQFPAMQQPELENGTRDMEKVNTFAAPLVDGFVLFKANGDYFTSFPKEIHYLYTGNHSEKAYFKEPKLKEKLYFSDWIRHGDKLKILVSNPIYNTIVDKNFPAPSNALSGILMAQVDFDRTIVNSVKSLSDSGIMHWIVAEDSGEVLYHSALPRQQSVISQPSEKTLLANALLKAFDSTVLAPGLHYAKVGNNIYTIVSSRSRVGPHKLMVNLAYDDIAVTLLVREKTDRIYLLGLVFLLMLIAAAVMLFRQIVRRQALTAQTEKLSSELKLRKEKKQLSEQVFQLQKMESLGELAAGTAHELNNALSEPMGMISLMQLEPEMSNEKRKVLLTGVMDGLKQTRDIVDGLLRFSRREKNEKHFEDLNTDVRFVLDMYQMEMDISGIQINLSLQQDLPKINAAHRQLQQVLLNLISNAKYAMPNGGKLLVSTRLEMHANIQGVAVCILDTGLGMDAKTQQRIFEPFYSTKPVGEGTGLGLSICYGIIKDHGGYLSVQSEPGEGSEFTVWLPIEHRGGET